MKNLNLCEILKGHEGETFYSPIAGNVKLLEIVPPYILRIDCETDNEMSNPTTIILYSDGKFREDGEIILFPSKGQRDWNKWVEEQKHKVPKIWNEMKSCNVEVWQHISHMDYGSTEPIVKSTLALLKIHQLIEVGYGGNVLCNKEGHCDGGIYGYTISIRPSSKTYLTGYEIIPIERSNDVVSPIMFKTKEYAQEFIKHEENCSLLRIFNMVAYSRDIK